MEKGKERMLKPIDPFWGYVEKKENKLKCRFCSQEFAITTSIARIKLHLSGEEGRGTHVCKKVPDNVKEGAYLAILGSQKRRKVIPISTNAAVGSNEILTSPYEQINHVEDPALAGVGRMPMMVESTSQGMAEGRACLGSEMEEGCETMNYLLDEPDLLDQGTLNFWPEIHTLVDGDADCNARQCVNEEWPMLDGFLIEGEALLTTKLVGQSFKENLDEILSCLAEDGILTIGVYGMGGVGKTTLMMHVFNQLKTSSNCTVCVWITASQDFSIYKLQYLMANAIGLDISNEVEEKRRAAKLSKALTLKKKIVIFLDDLWDWFRLEDVGIPIGLNRCKMILTTRSYGICRRMGSHRKIQVNPLLLEEAWTLFEDKLGNDMELPVDVKQIAKSIAMECAGLPLGIITMAGSMRGVEDVCEWRNSLSDLKQSKVRQDDMEPEVFQVLKLSYFRLNDPGLRQCFLYCALFPEDFEIDRVELIGYLIDEGMIEEMNSRQEEFDKGHAMLNKLENVCLLERCGDGVKMHDLIRDMALQIQKAGSCSMIYPCTQLVEFPDEEKWTEDLTRVSLMENHFKTISCSYSPRCPALTTLLLCRNRKLEMIGNLFFERLHVLRILDVSYTSIQRLPDAVSSLVNLISLLLRWCKELKHVPCLAKLRRLKKLDVSHTGVEKVPKGMKSLENLKHLDLCETQIQVFPVGLLPVFPRLQVLKFGWLRHCSIKIIEELRSLKKLETLSCYFRDIFELNCYLRSRNQYIPLTDFDIESRGSLSCYQLVIGSKHRHSIVAELDRSLSKRVELYNCSIGQRGSLLELPFDIQEFVIVKCRDARSLCGVSSLKFAVELKFLHMRMCDGMECLVFFFFPGLFDRLEILHLQSLKNLRALFDKEGTAPRPLPSNGAFSCLRKFKMAYCDAMKRLFPSSLLRNLQNIEEMVVWRCLLLEDIIGDDESISTSTATTTGIELGLLKLRCLILIDLPALRSICYRTLVCSSLQDIEIIDCPELKRVQLSLPLRSLESIKTFPKEWWEAVEWGDPSSKIALQSKCAFRRL